MSHDRQKQLLFLKDIWLMKFSCQALLGIFYIDEEIRSGKDEITENQAEKSPGED